MLSKTSIVILGELCKEDLSAYDILKKIEQMNMKYWWPIGDTTLYETAVRLEKKSYMEGTQSGNKLIYHITEAGRAELVRAICTIFSRMDYDTIWMSIAVLYCRILPENKLRELISRRKAILAEHQKGIMMNQKYHEQSPDVPLEADLTVERMLNVTELEMEFLDRYEKQIFN